MKLVDKTMTKSDLAIMAKEGFGNLVKAVVDIQKGVMVLDGSLHSDEEAFLLTKGSHQSDLWGINLYPELDGEDYVEFDSMINVRPSQGNMSRGVDSPEIQKRIRIIVSELIKRNVT